MTADNEIHSFLLIYLLPLITKDIEGYDWIVWGVIAFFFCVMLTTSYGYHFNPFLVILGYHFYKVTERGGVPHLLITTRRLRRSGQAISVVQLSEYVLIELEDHVKKPSSTSL